MHHRRHRHQNSLFLLLLLRQHLQGQAAREQNYPTGRRLTVWQFFRESPRVRRRLAVLGLVSVAPLAAVVAFAGELSEGAGALLFIAACFLGLIVFLAVSAFWLFEALQRRG